jgi:radical SAM superfamily enzyme YgiQ (UPF0313 family)
MLGEKLRTVLISTYDLGHQPFGLASPAAWLRQHGHEVTCIDLSVGPLIAAEVRQAALVAFFLPMHTATRLALRAIEKVQLINASAHLCCYGLYAPLNEPLLRQKGIHTVLGGEFEPELLKLAGDIHHNSHRQQDGAVISLEKLRFIPPDRSDLPALARYPGLRMNGATRVAGYTEATRGCKHRCRHCPVVPVYNGVFRVVQQDVVLEDARKQITAGAAHITFGDPDFLNAPTHAFNIVRALHAEFPNVTYDVTTKIEHLLRHRKDLDVLRETGCLFVTSAVESTQDEILERLDKGHTRSDFVQVAHDFREAGLVLSPTFVPFTPWTTWDGYRDLLRLIVELDLVDHIAPVQLTLRLLVPEGSRLLDMPDLRSVLRNFDAEALVYPWDHPDPALDRFALALHRVVLEEQKRQSPRRRIFGRLWEAAFDEQFPEDQGLLPRVSIPYSVEPWYCCAEPTQEQVALV